MYSNSKLISGNREHRALFTGGKLGDDGTESLSAAAPMGIRYQTACQGHPEAYRIQMIDQLAAEKR